MTQAADVAVGSAGRVRSMRSRWHRAFAVLTAVVILSGVASFVGSRLLIDTYRGSAVRLEREDTGAASLRADIVAEAIAVASPITAAQQHAQVAARAGILTGFTQALADDRSAESRRELGTARAKWVALVTMAGPVGRPASITVRAGAVTTLVPQVLILLDQAGATTRAAVRLELAKASRLDREALGLLAVLELLSIAVVAWLVRSMSTQVLKPVRALRDSANALARGELDHRIVVDRADELGELAASFNMMADAIAGSQRSLSLEANTDSLSGLLNRAAFRGRLGEALTGIDRRTGSQALLFVDLDDFKDVNDLLGHAAGDEVLRVVAARLDLTVRPGDLVARLGGDEFALLLEGLPDVALAMTLADRIVSALAEPVLIGESLVHVGASVGLAMRQDNSTVEGLMREADVAMYAAKGKGKNRVEQYDAVLDDAAVSRQLLRADLAVAAEAGELRLDYQPVVELDTGMMVGAEALVRWQHPTRGLLQPGEFIEVAESTGAIVGIGAWVLETATRQLCAWQRDHERPTLWISVNVSVCQLEEPDYAEQIQAALRRVGLDPASLVVEVTESVLADPNGGAAAALAVLREAGVCVALDDFGTGYSSIGYLRQLPVDVLKIDQSFVAGASVGAPGNALLEAIVGLAEHLGLDVIPEGIEASEELSLLRSLGCRLGQGFLLSRPVPAASIGTLLGMAVPFPQMMLVATDG